MVKRQSQTSSVLPNFNPQNSNAVGGLSSSTAAADSIDLQQDAILGAFLLSSTLSAAALTVLSDINAISGTSDSVADSPLPASSADGLSGEFGFQAAAVADASNVSTGNVTGAPLALSQHASDESGQSVTDTGINVGVLPDSFSNLDGAAQAVADGALPPTSDIQTLNELSSDGTDELQIVHDVAHGSSMAFYPADNGEQNLANGIFAMNAANAQAAAPDALGTLPASITGFSVSTGPTITTAGMMSVALPDNPAPGTAIAIPPDYSWVGFAVEGSPSGSESGTGSTVVAVTSGGITIDLLFDTAAMAAPASFRTGIEQAASLIAAAISDKITVNINIDYSGTGGGASAGPDNGLYESYTSIRADLISNATPGDTTFNALPSGSSIQGQTQVAVWNAQLKLFGLLSPNSTSTDDGSATFATDIQSNLLVGVAIHELTHAMGRVPYGPEPDIFDFFRFTSAGNYLFSGNIPAPAAYFSVNGGTTNLAYYGLNSDPSDFLNVSPNLNDPFDEYYSSSTTQTLTPLDLEQLDALGFNLTAASVSYVTVSSGQTLNIASGQTGVGDIILSGGNEFVFAGGTSTNATLNGGYQYVYGSASGTVVLTGSFQDILAGGTANSTTINSGGTQYDNGTASGTTVSGGGTEYVFTGATAGSTTINSGGVDFVFAGGAANSTTVNSGGAQYVYGTSSGTTLNAGGIEFVYAGGTSSSATLNGGDQILYGSVSGTVVLTGSFQDILAGSTASSTTINSGGVQYDNGTASGTTVSGGGTEYVFTGATAGSTTINSGGVDFVFAGGTANSTTVNSGGAQYVYGTASGTTLNAGGIEFDYASGTSSSATLNGGDQYVYGSASGTVVLTGSFQDILAGGTANSTTINSGGVQYDNGTASGTTVSGGGTEYVFTGATASSTTINSGGVDFVFAGGTANSTTVNSGGAQYVYGTASGTTLNGGSEFVYAGGAAGSTTLSGGSEIVMSGGIANGTITFAGSGQLTLNISTNVNNFQISGFITSADKLDLADIAYGGKTTLSFVEASGNTSGTLTVSDTVHTANITLLGLYTTLNFTTVSDGHGGTIIFV